MNDEPEVETIYVLDSDLSTAVTKKIILSLVGLVVIEVGKPIVQSLVKKAQARYAARKAAHTEAE